MRRAPTAPWRWLVLFAVAALLCSPHLGTASSISKTVKAVVKTQWQGFPVPMEACEFFADESNEDYWRFVEAIGVVSDRSDRDIHQQLEAAASSILNSDQKTGLFNMALAINYYNPRLQMFAHQAQIVLGQTSAEACDSWVYFRQKVLCEIDAVEAELAQAGEVPNPSLSQYDHIYPQSFEDGEVVILYAEPGSASFHSFHSFLSTATSSRKLNYVLRPFTNRKLEPINARGYGVELAIKNLEYKAMDTPITADHASDELLVVSDESDGSEQVQGFDFAVLAQRFPTLSTQLAELRESLLSGDDAIDNLSKWEFKDLGVQAVQHILTAEDPFQALRDVSQNVPTAAPLLSKLKRDAAIHQQVLHNSERLEQGTSILQFNGQTVNGLADPFTIFELLREQIGKFESLRQANITRSSIFDLLSLPGITRISPRIQLNSEHVIWLNNLEVDGMYKGWPRSVRDLLRQTFPGQLHFISKNLFNLLCVLDISDGENLEWISMMLNLIYRSQAPLRMGFLMLIKDELPAVSVEHLDRQPISVAVAKAVQYFSMQDRHSLTTFLQQLVQQPRISSISRLKEIFVAVGGGHWEDVMTNRVLHELKSVQSLLRDTGITSPMVFLNGFVVDIPSASQFTNQIASEIFRQRRQLQEWVHSGQLTDQTSDIYDWLLQQDGFPSYNSAIFPSSAIPEVFDTLSDFTSTSALASLTYISAPNSLDSVKEFTHLIVANPESPSFSSFVTNALMHVADAPASRLAFISCEKADLFGRVLVALRTGHTGSQALPPASFEALLNLVREWPSIAAASDSVAALMTLMTEFAVPELSLEMFQTALSAEETFQKIALQTAFCRHNAYSSDSGAVFIITNGRVISTHYRFSSTDFSVLETYEAKSRVSSVVNALSAVSFDGIDRESISAEKMSNIIQLVCAALSKAAKAESEQTLQLSSDINISFESRNLDSAISVVAVLDPLSAVSQRVSSLLLFLKEYLDPDMRIVLNPKLSISDLPLKNFFRYALEPIRFDADGRRLQNTEWTTFTGLPQRRVLTMNVHPPAPWLVEAVSCKYDLDNILLAQLPVHERSLTAVFELNHILVEGSCSDESNSGTPPRGLQLNLGDELNPHHVDTLVMSNLGYFQLKASPGVWSIKLADGRASEIYRILDSKKVMISSWVPPSQYLLVERQPGKMSEPLFPEGESQDEGILGSVLGGLFGHKKGTDAEETINVFSLATGHLYERFLKIMMLSVVKKTNQPVKFWFLKNFLSPAFKEFIPHMAKQYNFTVELVTYKWPAWLWPQTEKQRIIWGYKILFLDVLFPLGVKKIIYVDADQVVRSDLKELWDLDLKGAPYGYTPFCSGEIMNQDTKGFRFWDHGFWSDHLRGKPYHISALYVVDLVRFRAMAAGDRLRATYDSLARDPNSLANLDQDLPNYMQHFVPIFSLPKEWLWCETWCSSSSKADAKTIDLCNNPLTKTPKLEAAVKILPEWTALDEEAKATERIFLQSKPL